MKAKWFSIKNFRSLINVKCHLSPNITVLAGMNESGKTNILEGLSKFNLKEKFTSADKPLYNKESDNSEITFCFEIDGMKLNKVVTDSKIDFKFEKKNYEFLVTRTKNNGNKYDFSGPLFDELNEKLGKFKRDELKEGNNEVKRAYRILSEYGVSIPERIRFDMEDKYSDILDKVIKIVEFIKKKIRELKNLKLENKQELEEIINKINSIKYTTDFDSYLNSLKIKMAEHLPNIILFKAFEDILPFEEEISKLADLKIFKDLCKITGLDINQLQKTNDAHERRIILDSATATLEGDFLEYWHQDKITIKPEVDGNKLRIFFYDKGESVPFKPEQRSKGLLWFLSFYITLKAEGKENKENGNIILIDEPGFYLHAKAQEDVLKILESISKENQVIFTTHMPYLIDPHKLDRIRLIIRDNDTKETRIENSISKGADIETLKPIVTAIGLDISKGLGIAKEKNVILEGISDYYYIQMMKKYLTENGRYKFPEDICFIPSVGADKIPMLVPLFIGWGLKYSIILDSDKKGKDVKKKLLEQGVPEEKIILVGKENDCMEDLFSVNDFRQYVLDGNIAKGETRKNSEIIKDHKYGKALTAKLFYDKVQSKNEIKLDQKTISSFTELFEKIKAQF